MTQKSNMLKRCLSVLLTITMIFTFVPLEIVKVNAVTFDQLNASNVFLKQEGSTTCTLSATTMMMRRYSMLRGDSGWSSITESSVKSTAWISGTGLKWSFSYSNASVSKISVGHYTLPGGNENEALIQEILKKCPEGIVIYNESVPHAVLLTDYSNGIYYCADPLGSIEKGRIPLTSSYKVRISNVTAYWKITSPVVSGPTTTKTLKVYFNANGGSIDSDTYKLSNNLVYNISDGTKKYQPWVYNNKNTNGLVNYGTFGLYKTGYTFAGWGTKASGGTIFDQDDTSLLPTDINPNVANGDCSTTLYAIWEPNTLKVYFNANGGSISSDEYILKSSIVCNKSDSTKKYQPWTYNNAKTNGLVNYTTFGLYKTGYTFVGWGATASGDKIYSQSDDTLLPTTLNSNIKNGDCSTTLYAIWEPNELNVYFNANGGSINSDTYKLSSNIVCNISDNSKLYQTWVYNNSKTNGLMNYSNTMGLYKTGYIFAGWGTSPEGGTIFSQSDSELLPTDINPNVANGDCSTTLYAIWKSEDEIHSYTIEEIITESTCVTTGLKRISCSEHLDCGMYKEFEIPATGHAYGAWETIAQSTCMTSGSKIKKCACGETITESIDVLEHNYSEEWAIDKEPTCTTDGSKSRHCMNEDCLEKTDVTVISATGHNYSDWTTIEYPTCTTLGLREKSCDCSDMITESIDVLEHNYSTEWTIDADSTCTTDGSKSHHCLNCESKEDIIVISATGHNYLLEKELYVHPHTTTYKCITCSDEVTETPVSVDCLECNFEITVIDSTEYKLISYIGTETDVVIPAIYEGYVVTTIANSCFKGNTTITSVEIADSVTTIGALAFMNCTSLEKVIIPASVTTIGSQAFYGFTGTIYCTRNSVAHEYAVANNIDYALISIIETEQTQIDYDNFLIYTSVQNCGDIAEILGVTDTAIAIPTASHMYGNYELYGTGTTITVFDGNDYIGDFTLIVEGDLNGDSVCDVIDASVAQLYSAGFYEPTENEILAANGCSSDEIDVNSYQNVVNMVLAR